MESVTRLGTVEGLDTEAARARRTLVDAVAGRVRGEPAPEVPQRRSCSLVAHAATEDPIGTARPFDRYLMLELPLPWPPGMGTPVWETDRVLAPLRAALRRATRRTEELGLTMKTFAAAPDPEYSTPRLMRVIRFDQEPGPAAGLTRTEHSVPDTLAADLVDALFDDDPAALAPFAESRDTTPRRDLVVCTHASVDACCAVRSPCSSAATEPPARCSATRLHCICENQPPSSDWTVPDLVDSRSWAAAETQAEGTILATRRSCSAGAGVVGGSGVTLVGWVEHYPAIRDTW